MKLIAVVLTLLAAAFVPARASSVESRSDDDPWIHIQVLENGGQKSRVEIHLPLSLVEVALDMAPADVMAHGRLKVHSSDFTVAEMRWLWNELRAAGDAEFVTVEETYERVTIAREGNHVLINVTALPAGTHKVKIEVPVSVVDALFAGDGASLDVKGALSQLKTLRGEILTVDDGPEQIRIWIDERPQGRR
jgi:hypothetical protein